MWWKSLVFYKACLKSEFAEIRICLKSQLIWDLNISYPNLSEIQSKLSRLQTLQKSVWNPIIFFWILYTFWQMCVWKMNFSWDFRQFRNSSCLNSQQFFWCLKSILAQILDILFSIFKLYPQTVNYFYVVA